MNPRSAARSLIPLLLAVVLTMAASLAGFTPDALASGARVESGGVVPSSPTNCDSVTLVIAGSLPNSCYKVVEFRVSDPEEVPVLGPVPVYRLIAVVRTEAPNPDIDQACTTSTQPYRVSKELGRLRFGTYLVEAIEYLHPYPASSTAPIDSNRISFQFQVGAGADSCETGDGCAMMGFAATGFNGPRLDGCTARTIPGGGVCFDVTLQNDMPVGGLQTDITVVSRDIPWSAVLPLAPISVTTTPRTQDFTVTWVKDGWRAKIILYAVNGAAIRPGRGAVLHVCYRVHPDTPQGEYPIGFENAVLASPQGDNIPFCPSFAEVLGRICVGASGCDVNHDGIADVRDIALMVRCALRDSSACPDSIRERADSNDDGFVNIQDVIGCVRDILAHDGGWGTGTPSIFQPGNVIGFVGPVRWSNATEGRSQILMEPTEAFGGAQFLVKAGGSARVRGVSLIETISGPYAVEWSPDPDGRGAKVVVFHRGLVVEAGAAGSAGAAPNPLRLRVDFEAEGAQSGTLDIMGVRGTTISGGRLYPELKSLRMTWPVNAALAVASVLPARPNPFVRDTEITYTLNSTVRASLKLYDVNGRLVRTLRDGTQDAGVYHARWDGRDDRGRSAGVGIYFIRFEADGRVVRTDRILRLR